MFVGFDFSKYDTVEIYTEEDYPFSKCMVFKAKEIVSNPNGSVLYFDKDISKHFKVGETYPALAYINDTSDYFNNIMKDVYCADGSLFRMMDMKLK